MYEMGWKSIPEQNSHILLDKEIFDVELFVLWHLMEQSVMAVNGFLVCSAAESTELLSVCFTLKQ